MKFFERARSNFLSTIKVSQRELIQSQEMIAGGRYLSSDDPIRTFAMSRGDANLTVIWPDRKRSIIENVKPNRIYIVDYEGALNLRNSPTTSSALFSARKIASALEHKESIKSCLLYTSDAADE